MPLYGYTIGDADVSAAAGNQFQVYRFPIAGPPRTPQLVDTITVADVENPDLEGLGTNPTTRRVSAVNEPDSAGAPTPDPTFRIGNVDAPNNDEVTFTAVRNTATVTNRFGTETGADFGLDFSRGTVGNRPVVLYALGSNDDSAEGPVGSSLYKIDPATGNTLNLVDNTPTARERDGLSPTNGLVNGGGDIGGGGVKYADGLAVDNLTPGRTRAFASDFRTNDGDGNQLHTVDLLTGQLSGPIQIRVGSLAGPLTNYNEDSGLAFTQESPNQLYALLEDRTLLRFGNFTDELSSVGGNGGDRIVTVDILTPVTGLPLSGGEYEGFTIVNEPVSLAG